MKHFRKLRPMSKFVKLALEEVYPGKVGLNIMRESRAANDPLVMLELVVAGELQKKDTAKQVFDLLLNLTNIWENFGQLENDHNPGDLSLGCCQPSSPTFRYSSFKHRRTNIYATTSKQC
jgi:hypothetical protein